MVVFFQIHWCKRKGFALETTKGSLLGKLFSVSNDSLLKSEFVSGCVGDINSPAQSLSVQIDRVFVTHCGDKVFFSSF